MKRLLRLVGLACLAACSPQQLQVPPDASSVTEKIDALFPSVLDESRVPGAAVALVMGGKVVWAKGYGEAAQGEAVTPETLFQVASVSKPVAAWGVMRLVQEGRLELDAPVGRYLKRWQLPASKFDPSEVTLRRVLSHTAGLSVGGYYGLERVGNDLTIIDVLNGKTPGDGEVELTLTPGQKERYSGGGYSAVELLVEDVTGEPFTSYMRETVLAPLGMETATFDASSPGTLSAPVATGHDQAGEPLPFYFHPEHAAASLLASANDMAQFVAASLSGNGVLSSATLRAMQTAQPNSSFGLGYHLRPLANDVSMVYHSGSNRGWRSFIALFPEQALGVVILTNGDSGNEVIDKVMKVFVN